MTVQFLSKLSKLASTFFSTFERNYTDTLACQNFDGQMLFDHSVCTCIHETVFACWAISRYLNLYLFITTLNLV